MPHYSEEEIRNYLLAVETPPPERADWHTWTTWNLRRFRRTLELVPPAQSGDRCLEIGSIPYTFALLMKRFHQYSLAHVDFFAGGERQFRKIIRLPALGETHEFASELYDVEREDLPFPDKSFAGVLCCEVLEHLTTDPVAMLAEIHRVLRPNGWLVLTTPNSACLRNVVDLLHGRNIYRPYALAFGPTWRHNRGYTAAEVRELLLGCGFEVEHLSVEDIAPNRNTDLSVTARSIGSCAFDTVSITASKFLCGHAGEGSFVGITLPGCSTTRSFTSPCGGHTCAWGRMTQSSLAKVGWKERAPMVSLYVGSGRLELRRICARGRVARVSRSSSGSSTLNRGNYRSRSARISTQAPSESGRAKFRWEEPGANLRRSCSLSQTKPPQSRSSFSVAKTVWACRQFAGTVEEFGRANRNSVCGWVLCGSAGVLLFQFEVPLWSPLPPELSQEP